MATPKAFISYSWTNAAHENWVLRLATDLVEAGVDTIIDKWDLKEGHDATAFMERMVTDPEIKKVILVCDRAYAEKTNDRKGGVGTEAQIISPKIYKTKDQDKFVAIVTENDETGNPFLPAYYESRIFIDFSDISLYSDKLDQLLRWVYDEPLHKKPELGAKPTFTKGRSGGPSISVSNRHHQLIDKLKTDSEHGIAYLRDYFTGFSEEIEEFRLSSTDDNFDTDVIDSINDFLPYRNELLTLFSTAAVHENSDRLGEVLHRFFESLIPYMMRPEGVNKYREWDFDNFRFIIQELFLYCIAITMKFERFNVAAHLVANDYYSPRNPEYNGDPMVHFTIFRNHLRSLKHRNDRLKLGRHSVHAGLIEERCKGIDLRFSHLMQADFTLFIRYALNSDAFPRGWWPETLVFAGRQHGPFEVFARSRSKSYFDRVKTVMGIDNKDRLIELVNSFDENPSRLPSWQFDSFNPATLLGIADLATKP